MVRVKLLCGNRPFQMENASMKEAIKASAKRLGCQEEDVTLKFEEDGTLWEIEGESTYKSAVADGWTIIALFNNGKQPRKRRRSSTELDHSAGPVTSSKRVSQTSSHSAVHTPPGSPHRPKNAPSRSPTSRPSNVQPIIPSAQSKTLPLSTQDQMRSSGRAWTDKDKSFLWRKLIEQLQDYPPFGLTYSLDERRDVFNKLLQSNAKRFEGRTALVLEGRIQRRVSEMRKAKQRIPGAIEALFPHSRVSQSRTPPQPSTSRTTSDRPILSNSSAIERRRSADAARIQSKPVNGRPFAPSTSTANVQQQFRRRYEIDAIRVEALDIPGPSRRRNGLDSLSVTDEPDNDADTQQYNEDGETENSSGPSTFDTNMHPLVNRSSKDPLEQVASTSTRRKNERNSNRASLSEIPSANGTISNDSIFAPDLLSSSTYEPTDASIKEEHENSPLTPPETPRGSTVDVQGEADTSRSTSLAPSVKVEDTDVSQISDMPPSIRASLRADDVRKEITSALDLILSKISPDSPIDPWAEKMHKKLSRSCFVVDSTDDTRFNSVESAYCLFAALDELFRYTFLRSQSVQERRLFIVAIAMLFEGLHARMYLLTGFEVLLCKFFHQVLFDGPHNSVRFSAQLIACSSLLIHPYTYDSILDGVLIQPWSKKHSSVQQNSRLSPSETEQTFIRMGEVIESLHVAMVAVQQCAGSRKLAEKRTKPIRFSFRSWKRIFEETQCDSHNSWRTPELLLDVRQGMEKWNKLPIAITTKIINQDNQASTSKEKLTFKRTPVPTSTTMSAPSTGHAPSLHTSPARNTRSNQQSQLFLGLPEFSQSGSQQ